MLRNRHRHIFKDEAPGLPLPGTSVIFLPLVSPVGEAYPLQRRAIKLHLFLSFHLQHLRLFLKDCQHTFPTCQGLIQIVGKIRKCRDRTKGAHHGHHRKHHASYGENPPGIQI